MSFDRPQRDNWSSFITDRLFDDLLSVEHRALSAVHWTPVDVAIRAVTLLAPLGNRRVLDVGAGVGKLCLVGALSTNGMWCGIEEHEILVRESRRIAEALGVTKNTMFLHGNAFSVDWHDFDAIYLYNPFQLPIFDIADPKGHAQGAREQVLRVQDRLDSLRAGVRVVTLNGFGGVMPASYRLVYQERIPLGDIDLVLWVKESPSSRVEAR